ncbi:MAG: T9SS type A sorting domain-containing protein [Chitinophagaceae bacterium]|nr:MAG: T9SS type A sorting domain-containing protein [Chitinophagaceae bacterium]
MMRSLMMSLLLMQGIGAFAQTFTLLKDINTASNGSNADNYTAGPGGLTYFTADLPNSMGRKLFKTDGTTAGTLQLGNINADRTAMLFTNGRLYFTQGGTLWSTDGTETGTAAVKTTGTIPGSIQQLTASNGKIIFIANGGGTGLEPWVSDGTDAGTFLLKDIYPGSTGSDNPGFGSFYLTDVNGVVFFTARDNTANGFELWKTDGTPGGTVMVRNIHTTANSSSNPIGFTALGSTVYFTADNGTNGVELWKSDGTTAGTVIVRDIIAGTASSFVGAMAVKGTELFFHMGSGASVGLWKTNGTTAGTVAVKTGINPYGGMINVGGTLFFGASAGSTGVELYKSDGSTAGTVLLKEIYAGTESSYPELYTNVNGTLFFVARQESFNDREVWKSDGTPAGTVIVKNLQPAPGGGSFPYSLTASNNKLYFSPSQAADASGMEPWVSDGTAAGTFQLKDINYFSQYSVNDQNSLLVGGELYFSANSIYGLKMAKTDGTTAGTVLLTETDASHPNYSWAVQNSTPYQHANGITYFTATQPVGSGNTEVWRTDGTVAGTIQLKDIDGNPFGSSQPSHFTRLGNQLFFFATTPTEGRELWKTDGTTAGTVLVKDIYPGVNGSNPSEMIEFNGALYFRANGNDGAGTELWKSDGTAAGTTRLKDIVAGTGSSFPTTLVKLNNRIYFIATETSTGTELWVSDGTDAGTVILKDIVAGAGSSNISSLTAVNNRLYFAAYSAATGSELWMSDGSNAGTVMLADVYPGTGSSNIADITAAADKIYFVATNGTAGRELWVSDGTTAGTSLVKDIRVGSSDANIAKMTFVDGVLFFSAFDGINGVELWRSTGTAAFTTMVADFWPGGQGGIGIIARLPNHLMVGFNSAEYSYEPWVATLQNILPVKLLSFDGYLLQKDARLMWKTTNEENMHFYEVQRSLDGSHFTTIGNQPASNGPGICNYNYTDAGIANTSKGMVYYRLKQADRNGSYTYSKIVPVFIPSGKETVLLFPNPVKEKAKLLIHAQAGSTVRARLMDMNGNRLQNWQWKMSGDSQVFDLWLANIAAGSYLLEIQGEGSRQTLPLIKD